MIREKSSLPGPVNTNRTFKLLVTGRSITSIWQWSRPVPEQLDKKVHLFLFVSHSFILRTCAVEGGHADNACQTMNLLFPMSRKVYMFPRASHITSNIGYVEQLIIFQ